MAAGVEADGLHLVCVGLAVRHRGLLHRAVEDLTDDVLREIFEKNHTAGSDHNDTDNHSDGQ